jgi:pimeloyl-ACP methyl ester carboxylesterase
VPDFVTSDGVRLHYELRGRGRRVFACAGGPANDFTYLAEDLAQLADEFELVYHDYRGSGRSQSAPAESYSFERMSDDLDELRAELGDGEIVVLGHSMGGLVALAYALRHAERCQRLVLVGTFPTTVPRMMVWPTLRALGWARCVKMLVRAVSFGVAFSWRRPSMEKTRRMYEIWATTQEGHRLIQGSEVERERRLGLPLENDNIAALQRELRSLDFTERLVRISCPVLVMFGERDAAAAASAHTFGEHVSDLETVALPELGHDPFFESPDDALATVRAFLA